MSFFICLMLPHNIYITKKTFRDARGTKVSSNSNFPVDKFIGLLDLPSILCGSISLIIFSFWFFRDEYELLEAVQAKLAVHPLTSPILGNDHYEYRSRENPVRVMFCFILF